MKKKLSTRLVKKAMVRGDGGGGGGKGGGGGSARVAVEAADSIRSKQFATVVDVISEGPIFGLVDGLKSIYFDETPITSATGNANFTSADVQWNTGTQDQPPLLGVSDIETERAVNVAVLKDVPVTQTVTNVASNSVRVTLLVPGLTSQDMSTGDINGSSVAFTIDVMDTGGGTGYIPRVSDTIEGKTSSGYKRSYLIKLSGEGPWLVRVTRLTPDSTTASVQNRLIFDSYTSIIDSKLSYPNTALVSTRIDAANFSSIPSRAYDIKGLIIRVPTNYDPTTRVYSGTWDGSFKLAWSDNPAWCFYDLLTNDRYGLGEAISEYNIDKWSLYQIGQYCDVIIPDGYGGLEPRFTCNLYLQTREDAYKVVQNFASIFRAITFWGAASIVTVQDRPSDAVALYTNANVVDGEFTYQGASLKQRHTVVLVSWNDPEDFYRQKIEYVQDDESVILYGVVQTEIAAFGCTSRGQAHRAGKWLLATEKWSAETVAFKAGLDTCVLYPGAIIKTSDKNRSGKRMAGRIKSSTTSELVLDQSVTIEAGKTYSISVTGADATAHTSTIYGQVGTTDTITLLTHLTEPAVAGATYILAANDLVAEQWRVVGVKEESDMSIGVMAVAHYDSLFTSIDNDTRFSAPVISNLKARPDAPAGLNAISTPYVVQGKIVGLKISLSWQSTAARFRVSWMNSEKVSQSREVYESSIDIDNVVLDSYSFSVVAISPIGIESLPATYVYTVNGKTEPPKPVKTFNVVGDMFQNVLNWSYEADLDIKKVEIWGAATGLFINATKLCDISYPTTNWVHIAIAMGVTITYWIRVQDNSDNYSVWTGPAAATTISDPDIISSMLAQEVTSSSLFKSLVQRIGTIDGPATQPGSIAEKLDYIKVVNATNVAAIAFGQSAVVTNTGAVVEAIQTLQSTVDGNTAAIQIQSQVTNGMSAEYKVTLDNNGYVSGFGQSSSMVGGAFQSDFTVLADRFAVVTPGVQKNVPFAIGTINGVMVVGINGAVITDGTISSKAIRTADLLIQARDTGARMSFTPDVIKVYDELGNVRVKIGNLLG